MPYGKYLLLVAVLLAGLVAVLRSADPIGTERPPPPPSARPAFEPPPVLPPQATPPASERRDEVIHHAAVPSDDPRKNLNPVDLGLAWLAGAQNEDGSWSAEGFEETRPAVTGLALLAFLGDGETHKHGAHKKTIKYGLKYLKMIQTPTGSFGSERDAETAANHAIATLAMCEAYHLTGSPLFKQSATQGIQELYRDMIPGSSVGFWSVLALTSATAAKLRIPDGAVADAKSWLDWITDVDTGVATCGSAGLLPDSVESQTAAAALCRVLMGEDPAKSELVRRATGYVAAHRPAKDDRTLDADLLYFGFAACYQQGGETWKKWYPDLVKRIEGAATKEGKNRGSWEPTGDSEQRIGRVGTTALLLMAEQLYYRYYSVLGARR